MKKLKIVVFIISIVFVSNTLYSKIYKKILQNGDIEYYNSNKTKIKKRLPSIESKFSPLIEKIAKTEGINPKIIKCIIKVESNFNPNAVSVAGAMGLMQLMEGTANIYHVTDPFSPSQNITAGTKHFKILFNYFKGDIPLALAAYHAGLGIVRKHKSIPPIKSTIRYVRLIMRLYTEKFYQIKKIKKLYKKIDKFGDIIIYGR